MWPYGLFQNENKIYFLLTKLKQISYIKKISVPKNANDICIKLFFFGKEEYH